jgi:hypothetical protein
VQHLVGDLEQRSPAHDGGPALPRARFMVMITGARLVFPSACTTSSGVSSPRMGSGGSTMARNFTIGSLFEVASGLSPWYGRSLSVTQLTSARRRMR